VALRVEASSPACQGRCAGAVSASLLHSLQMLTQALLLLGAVC
jgi:hypothetical protein